jgi:DNA-binding NtrC family response regulator
MESRQGLLEMADGGTFLIDEVGEITPANQVALLRIVETGSFRRLGGSKELSVDVRIIAATNRKLEESVAGHQFREDLFYRLEVLRFEVPPLRERVEDVPLLAEHFLTLLNRARGTRKRISREQKELLKSHHWPGNVRELANVIERCYYLSSADDIDLSGFTGHALPVGKQKTVSSLSADESLSDVERAHVLRVLAATQGNKKEAARILEISRSRLYNLLKKYGDFISPDA